MKVGIVARKLVWKGQVLASEHGFVVIRERSELDEALRLYDIHRYVPRYTLNEDWIAGRLRRVLGEEEPARVTPHSRSAASDPA
jgi:hypothetical protein